MIEEYPCGMWCVPDNRCTKNKYKKQHKKNNINRAILEIVRLKVRHNNSINRITNIQNEKPFELIVGLKKGTGQVIHQ